ncbi:MAG: helix-turn-helix transcriptional regulator [Rhodospirillaceae bacterium]|jgi:putative molybdopterin biosynthesis protein|nr:helix-turn-helix transcriptional regulator [Rhodospirillaceae bacterium]
MNTHEVADYLRIKERKVYDLVRNKQIPCTRASGKWLFPKNLIDRWLADGVDGQEPTADFEGLRQTPPPVIAGSHDPLLDWGLLDSNCGLALLGGGSLNGLKRFIDGEALACGLHIIDGETGQYNVPALKEAYGGRPPGDLVLIEWAQRQQGLILPAGNPKGITGFDDLMKKKSRIQLRQPAAGTRILFEHLIGEAGIEEWDFNINDEMANNETELGFAIRDRKADAGLGLASVAQQFELDFIPLCYERFDILIRRRDYFDEPFQMLIAKTRTEYFVQRARDMGGYDISQRGKVHFNG